MSLVDSPSLVKTSNPIRSTSLPSQAYVSSLTSLSSMYAAASSAPTNAIHLFDKSNLQKLTEFPAHRGALSCLRAVQNFSGAARELLISCGKDGLVKAWDERSGTVGVEMYAITAGKLRALLSCDVSSDGMTVAAGTDLQGEDASILYWDPRNPSAPLRTHTATHSDDITGVHFSRNNAFSPSLPNVLLSVSSDGLICTSNADEDDEDEAGIHVGNWGCSIAQAGWIKSRSGSPGVWASSDMETFSTWTHELDKVHDVDIRQPSIHRQDFDWHTDYLIGCHNSATMYDDYDNNLTVFAGSNEGDIALMSRSSFSSPKSPWTLQRLYTTGHVGVVRSVLWDEENNIVLTGGEDSVLNAWSSPPLFSLNEEAVGAKREHDTDSMEIDENGDAARKRRRS